MEHLRAGERLSPASGSPATWLCRRVTSAQRPFNDDHQRADGWRKVTTKGSHRQFKHLRRLADDLAPGTYNSILKQAELKES